MRAPDQLAAPTPQRPRSLGMASTVGAAQVPLLAGLGLVLLELVAFGTGPTVLTGVALCCAVVATIGIWRVGRRLSAVIDLVATSRETSRFDMLTGLRNRTAFLADVEALARGHDGHIAVLFLDLDRFKEVNDTFGHRVGDQLLTAVAERLTGIVDPHVVLARLSGDEFAVALPLAENLDLQALGQSIVDAVSRPAPIDDIVVRVGASVGIAIGGDGPGIEELMRRADLAMYEAKRSAASSCRIYDAVLDAQQRSRGAIRAQIAQPGWLSELKLLYQPILDVRDNSFTLYESLLRWNSPVCGEVPPSTLIPIVEDSALIEQMTDWTMVEALRAMRDLDGAAVAVNISPVYFRHPEFVNRVFDRLIELDASPEKLVLELTEGVLIEDIDRAKTSISRLRDIGVRVFLDDFGTGFSSLSYLQHFRLDGLKLDKSFLRHVRDKSQSSKIVRTMIDFGHSLDMKIVVEGVESEWQLRLLQLLGCDYVQGYEVGTPQSIADIVAARACPRRSSPPPALTGTRSGSRGG